MEHTFVVEDKTFIVDIQRKDIDGKTKYIFDINMVRKNEDKKAECVSVLKSISISTASSEKDIPKYWNSESECLNCAHNWVDRNHQSL